MLWSKLFIPTLREDQPPLVKAGYMRGDCYLYLGERALQRIRSIVRQEMSAIGGQEFFGPGETKPVNIGRELRSYKQLPQIWYDFRELTVESVSYDLSADLALMHAAVFRKVLDRCGVEYVVAGEKLIARRNRALSFS